MRRQDRLANEISDLKDEGTINGLRTRPVSYTHLTLPTNREV